MGNSPSIVANPLYVSPNIKWKSGPLTSSIPADLGSDKKAHAYTTLRLSAELRNFLLVNLDSNHLVSSVLSFGNSPDDERKSLLAGISIVNPPDSVVEEVILRRAKVFQDCLAAGVDVQLSEALTVCEKELSLKYLKTAPPYLIAFQKRMGLLYMLKDSIIKERKDMSTSNSNSSSGFVLKTSKYPQLAILLSLKEGAIGLLRAFPACQNVLAASGQEMLLIEPIKQICTSIASMQSLKLFDHWSPKFRGKLSILQLKLDALLSCKEGVCSEGWSHWTCSGDGKWDAVFSAPQHLHSIKIAWVSLTLNQSDQSLNCSAPYLLTIFGSSEKDGQFVRIGSFKPDEEVKNQNSWIQTYPIKMKSVVKLKMVFSRRLSSKNISNTTMMYSCEIQYRELDDQQYVDTLQLLQDIQVALMPLVCFDGIAVAALNAMVVIAKISESLGLCLNLLQFVTEKQLNDKLIMTSSDSIYDLLEDICVEKCRLEKALDENKFSPELRKVGTLFDSTRKYPNCIFSNNDSTISCQPGSGYCFGLEVKGDSDFEWTMTITDGSIGVDEVFYLGLTKSGKDTVLLDDVWGVCCQTGKIISKGPKGQAHVCIINSNDCCRFIYDRKMETVKLYVNEILQGVVFEHLKNEFSPVVFFENLKSPISVSLTVAVLQTQSSIQAEKGTDELKIVSIGSSEFSILNTFLSKLAQLANLRVSDLTQAEVSNRSKQTSQERRQFSLEYPFSVEVSATVFLQLNSSLTSLIRHTPDSPNIKHLVDILDAQFLCLSLSRVDLSEIGMVDGNILTDMFGVSISCSDLISSLKISLRTLMKWNDEDIQLAAVRVFCRGMCLYFRSSADKVDLVLDILSSQNSYCINIKSTHLLLNLILQRFCNLSEVMFLLAMCSKESDHLNKFHLFLDKIVDISVSITQLDFKITDLSTNQEFTNNADIQKTICSFLSIFIQNAVLDITSESSDNDNITDLRKNPLAHTLLVLGKSLLCHASKLLMSITSNVSSSDAAWLEFEETIRNSIIGSVVQPFIYSICLQGHSLSFLQEILPSLCLFIEQLSNICNLSSYSKLAQKSLNSTIERYYPQASSTTVIGGWTPVKAVFEEPDSSYSVTDNGLTYTSLHSTNTCALLNVKFGKNQKAAWEFSLESDSVGDECSLFGAARMPLSSRCYSSSPDLWMRRSYNGYMYHQGQSTGTAMEKIHPNDIVRVEFDGTAGTISYSVNGGDLEVGFTDITEDVYPACGSYRNGVIIKVLKVEEFGRTASFGCSSDQFLNVPNESIHWLLDEDLMSTKDATHLSPFVSGKKDLIKKIDSPTWITARANKGACFGVHEYSFEVDAPNKLFAVGAIFGSIPVKNVRLADAVEYASKVTNSSINSGTIAESGKLTLEKYTPVESLPQVQVNVGPQMFAWHSNGSLWHNGIKCADGYGLKQLPLSQYSSIKIILNREERLISFFVDGVSCGVAFGPPLSVAAAVINDFPPPYYDDVISDLDDRVLFPAASIYFNPFESSVPTIKIKASGFHGSTVMPLLCSLQKTCASVVGRITALLLQGPDVNSVESVLIPWLQSPLLIGGLEESEANGSNLVQSKSWPTAINEVLSRLNVETRVASSALSFVRNNEISEEQCLIQKLAQANATDEECEVLFEWLELIDPESQGLKNGLEKSGTYSFPKCELPVLACFLKHGGLAVEAVSVVRKLQLHKDHNRPKPSNDMVSMWQKIKQLRTYLRKQRQNYKLSEYALLPHHELIEQPKNFDTEAEEKENHLLSLNDKMSSTPNVLKPSELIESAVPEVISINEDDLGERILYVSEDIIWTIPTTIESNSGFSCSVLSVGIDGCKENVYVRFSYHGIAKDALEMPQYSTLMVDGVVISDPEVYLSVDSQSEKKGCLRFATDTSRRNCEFNNMLFQYGKETDSITIEFDEKNEMKCIRKKITMPKFEELCKIISGKACFLLKLAPAVNAAEFNLRESKSSLLGLTKKYSGNIPPAGTTAELSKWASQERWKRVLGFLHNRSKPQQKPESGKSSDAPGSKESHDTVHGVVGNTGSSPRSTTVENRTEEKFISGGLFSPPTINEKLDDMSPGQAAMQTCMVFITTEAITSGFEEVLERRTQRANFRMYALNALSDICQISAINEDPFCLFEILLFIRVAIANFIPKSDAVKDSVRNKNHYLTNLEGCTTSTMSAVQSAFVKLYTTISTTFTKYLESWENHSIAACIEMKSPLRRMLESPPKYCHILLVPMQLIAELWTVNFSNRDHKWVMASGFLPSLVKLMSFSTKERALQTWMQAAFQIYDFHQLYGSKFEHKNTWNLWSPSYVKSGLCDGTLTGREVLLHLSIAPDSKFSGDEKKSLGIDVSFQQLLDNYNDISKVSYLFSNVVALANRKHSLEESVKKQKASSEEVETARKNKEMILKMAACGAFDPDHMNDNIRLSDFNLSATISCSGSGTAVCVFTTNSYSQFASQTSGNYFEVEIVRLGTDAVGIGFANRETFSTSSYMPGWEPNSYGYHSDDGRKFGANPTAGDWETFHRGEVIGCGFDMERRTIFYSRNGELLGDGFTDVGDEVLWPVIGFCDRHEAITKVKINFGVEPFLYNGDEVIINAAALRERQLNLQLNVDSKLKTEDASVNVPIIVSDKVTPENSGSINSDSGYVQQLSHLETRLKQASAFLSELNNFACYSALILRYLLLISSQLEVESEDSVMTNEPSSSASSISKPVLSKAISVFGTPKFVNVANRALIQQGLLSSFIHDLMVSTEYMQQKLTPKQTLTSMQDLYVIAQSNNSPELGEDLVVLDSNDMERMIYFHLQTVSTVICTSNSMREELNTVQTTRLLFSILHSGSPRNRSLSCHILMKLLPLLSPESVEGACISSWNDIVSSYETMLQSTSCRHRLRRMPDSVVVALYVLTGKELFYNEEQTNKQDFPSMSLFSPSENRFPFGFGDMVLQLANQKLVLLRTLFEAPLWNELMACCVTDFFRNAHNVLEDTNGEIDVQAKRCILQLACAACLSLGGFHAMFPGSTVVTEFEVKCRLINYSIEDDSATIVPLDRVSSIDFSQYVNTVRLSAIRVAERSVKSDLSRQSQPMLSFLLKILQNLLTWFSTYKLADLRNNVPSLEQTILRLLSSSSHLLLMLLTHQPDSVSDLIQDSNIAACIIDSAVLPINLNYLPKKECIIKMWIFNQARILEIVPPLKLSKSESVGAILTADVSTSVAKCIELTEGDSMLPINSKLSNEFSSSMDVKELVTTTAPHYPFKIDIESRKSTASVAAEISLELNIPQHICVKHLEYFMMNVDEARDRLKKIQSSVDYAEDYPILSQNTTSPTFIVSETDGNVLKNVEHASFPGNDFNFQVFDHELYVEPFSDSGDLSNEEKHQFLVVECTDEGSISVLKKSISIATYFDDTSAELLISKYDRSVGNVVSEVFPVHLYRVVKKFFNVDVGSTVECMVRADSAFTILQLRGIAAKLLTDGYLNLHRDTSEISNWLRLLKLLGTKSPLSSIRDPLESNCTELLSRAGSSLLMPSNSIEVAESSPLNVQLVDIFVQDVKNGLKQLSSSDTINTIWEKMTGIEDSSDYDSPLEFSSPHPFTAPQTTAASITIPKRWRSVSVEFNPKCATPTNEAVLDIYTTTEKYTASTPDFSFYGTHSRSGATTFKDFEVPNVSSLIYKFHAKPHADKQKVCWVPLLEQSVIKEKGLSLSIERDSRASEKSVPVGLGDDDSLFNLFGEVAEVVDTKVEDSTITFLNCESISFDNWYFETRVEYKDNMKESGVAIKQLERIGLLDVELCSAQIEGLNIGNVPGSIAVNALGEVYLNGTCVCSSPELGSWVNNDIISCLFSMEANGLIRVWFGKNGGWIPPFTCESFAKAVRPALSLSSAIIFSPNDGRVTFVNGPSVDILESVKTFNAIADLPSKKVDDKEAWGYHFTVRRACESIFDTCKEFDLIWRSKSKDDVVGEDVWIWRPKVASKFKSCGDIITTTGHPPRRTVVIDKTHCKSPKKFDLVFYSTKLSLAIWRPIPFTGFVALGDIAVKTTSSPPFHAPSTELIYCLPEWAVQNCDINTRVAVVKKVGETKAFTNGSLWQSENNLGHFFGSPYESRKGKATRTSSFIFDGTGDGWALKVDLNSLLQGEWLNESDVLSRPSVLWICNLLNILLKSEDRIVRSRVLTIELFQSLIKYMKMSNTPASLNVLPTIINMIRIAQEENMDLNLSDLHGLCKSILSSSAKPDPSAALMKLVDFVVEVQLSSIAKTLILNKLNFDNIKELMPISTSTLSTMQPRSTEWWERGPIPFHQEHRLIKNENVDKLFSHSLVAIPRLRQALKFLNAIGSNKNDPLYSMPYPKFMITTVWSDFVSNRLFYESSHPYVDRTPFSKTIIMQGAKKLSITFDRRLNLRKGDKLIFKNSETSMSVSSSNMQKGFLFKGNFVEVSFEADESVKLEENESSPWGWAFVVHGSGELYSTVSKSIKWDQAVLEGECEFAKSRKIRPSDSHHQANTEPTLSIFADDKFTSKEVVDTLGNLNQELLSSELEAVSLDRPHTQRGKRSQMNESSISPQVPVEEADSIPTDPEIAMQRVVLSGRVVSSGSIHIPYATKVTLTVKNPHATELIDYELVLAIHDKPLEDDLAAYALVATKVDVLIPKMLGSSFDYPASTVYYTLHALSRAKALDEQGSNILIKASSLELGEPSEAIETAVADDSCLKESIKLGASEETADNLERNGNQLSVLPDILFSFLNEDSEVDWNCLCGVVNPKQETSCISCGNQIKSADAAMENKVLGSDSGDKIKTREISILAEGILGSLGRFETLLEEAILSDGITLTPLQLYYKLSQWTKEQDEVLLDYMNRKKPKVELVDFAPLPEKYLSYEGSSLAHFTMVEIQSRILLLETFNSTLETFLPLIDLTSKEPSSMGAMIRKSSRYVLMKVKEPLLEKAIRSSEAPASGTDIPASIVLDNVKALNSRENGERDIATCNNCFMQSFQQLSKKDSAVFKHIISGDRVFQITFVGEGGIDAGGVFREGVSRIVEDLFSPTFNLLQLCHNGQHGVHANQDKYIPNIAYLFPPFSSTTASSTVLLMFEFIGKLMGMSLRAKLCLPFEFPTLIWKKLASEPVTLSDLFAIDAISANFIEKIRHCDQDAKDPVSNEEQFREKFPDKLMFEYTSSDGVVRELAALGGRFRAVTFADREIYCDAVLNARLSEFDVAVDAMRRGMAEVVPLLSLMLFSSLQWEELVCGSPEFDMDLWHSHTEVSGVSAATVALFWKVIEGLSHQDKAGFVRFAWGRSRLPPAKDFTVKMRLTSGGRAALPVSHTCFFSVELPEYKTEEEMRHGILTAVHYGVGGILMG